MEENSHVDNNDCVIAFGSLWLGKNHRIAPTKSSEKWKGTEVVKEEKADGPSSSSSSSSKLFDDLQAPRESEILDVIEEDMNGDAMAKTIRDSHSCFDNGENQNAHRLQINPFGMNNGSLITGQPQPALSSFHPNASIHGNSGLNFPPRMDNVGSNVDNSSPVMFNNNLWECNNNSIGQGYYSSLRINTQKSVTSRIFLMATNPHYSEHLRRFLEQGMYVKEVMTEVLPSVIQLMSDPYGHRIFKILLNRCESGDLHNILNKVIFDSESLVNAAFCEIGSRSIQRLVKKLKNTGWESYITQIFARFASSLMTHKIASHVIRQCFHLLGNGPNKVLHDYIFASFVPLAMHPMGCITINDCIDSITGPGRTKLLELVVNHSRSLSHDPSGNFVVQHVLELQNDSITHRICQSLMGQFVLLAQKKGGSHVVEKCLQSHDGRPLVIDEISSSEKTLCILAKHHYGNYVVQTALNVTRMHDEDMYRRLVQVLEPHYPKLVYKANPVAKKDEW